MEFDSNYIQIDEDVNIDQNFLAEKEKGNK